MATAFAVRRSRLYSLAAALVILVGSYAVIGSHAGPAAADTRPDAAIDSVDSVATARVSFADDRSVAFERPHWTPAAIAVPAAVPVVAAPSVQAVPGAPRTPASNIKMQHGYPSVCLKDSTSAACLADGVADLDHARAVMGLPAYALPADFAAMTAAQQMLTLSNDDRAIYGLTPISGLNDVISAAAAKGVARSNDAYGISLPNVAATAWTSNWAAGSASVAYLYFEMMYDDGPGSSNLDCQEGHGCWGHRQSVLHDFGSGNQVVIGVATGPSPDYRNVPSIAVLYEGFPAAAAVQSHP